MEATTMTAAKTEDATQTVQPPKSPKSPTSYSVRLTAGVEEVVITAYATRAGWTSAATRYRTKAAKGKKRTGERGASQQHTTQAAAKAAVEKLATAFVKNGWTRPERRAIGFARKPDAFNLGNLPKPAAKK